MFEFVFFGIIFCLVTGLGFHSYICAIILVAVLLIWSLTGVL